MKEDLQSVSESTVNCVPFPEYLWSVGMSIKTLQTYTPESLLDKLLIFRVVDVF